MAVDASRTLALVVAAVAKAFGVNINLISALFGQDFPCRDRNLECSLETKALYHSIHWLNWKYLLLLHADPKLLFFLDFRSLASRIMKSV